MTKKTSLARWKPQSLAPVFKRVTDDDGAVLRQLEKPEGPLPLIGPDGRIDALFVVDGFVRHATFDDAATAERLSVLTQELGNVLTFYAPQETHRINPNEFFAAFTRTLGEIDRIARRMNAPILLPYTLEAQIPFDAKKRAQLADKLTQAFPMTGFRETPYDLDLSVLGGIDTALGPFNVLYRNGLRGFVACEDALRWKWDRAIDADAKRPKRRTPRQKSLAPES